MGGSSGVGTAKIVKCQRGGILAGFRPMLVGTYIIAMTKFSSKIYASHLFIVQISTKCNALI